MVLQKPASTKIIFRVATFFLSTLLSGCFQLTRDEPEPNSGTNDSIPTAARKGFRPFYVGRTWVYKSHNIKLSNGSLSGLVDWNDSIYAESSAIASESLTVFFKVKSQFTDSLAVHPDSLRDGYIGNHGRYNPEDRIGKAGCDVDSWYPDSSAWGPVNSIRFKVTTHKFNIKLSHCDGSSPVYISGFWMSLRTTSYIDSMRGLLYKSWTLNGNEYGHIQLEKIDSEEIAALEIKSIADSLYRTAISDGKDKTIGEFSPFLVGNKWRYHSQELFGSKAELVKSIEVDSSALFVWGKMVFFDIKDSNSLVKEYSDSLSGPGIKTTCISRSWLPNSDGEKRIQFEYGGQKYSLFKDSCSLTESGSRSISPRRYATTSYVDSTRGLVYRNYTYNSGLDEGYCGSTICDLRVELMTFNNDTVPSNRIKDIYDSLSEMNK